MEAYNLWEADNLCATDAKILQIDDKPKHPNMQPTNPTSKLKAKPWERNLSPAPSQTKALLPETSQGPSGLEQSLLPQQQQAHAQHPMSDPTMQKVAEALGYDISKAGAEIMAPQSWSEPFAHNANGDEDSSSEPSGQQNRSAHTELKGSSSSWSEPLGQAYRNHEQQQIVNQSGPAVAQEIPNPFTQLAAQAEQQQYTQLAAQQQRNAQYAAQQDQYSLQHNMQTFNELAAHQSVQQDQNASPEGNERLNRLAAQQEQQQQQLALQQEQLAQLKARSEHLDVSDGAVASQGNVEATYTGSLEDLLTGVPKASSNSHGMVSGLVCALY